MAAHVCVPAGAVKQEPALRENSSMDSEVVEALSTRVPRLDNPRLLPASTYRLQFNASFTFRDAAEVAPYLRQLGVTHCYASPYLKAQPGSAHGYDITDHRLLNPEVGSGD